MESEGWEDRISVKLGLVETEWKGLGGGKDGRKEGRKVTRVVETGCATDVAAASAARRKRERKRGNTVGVWDPLCFVEVAGGKLEGV